MTFKITCYVDVCDELLAEMDFYRGKKIESIFEDFLTGNIRHNYFTINISSPLIVQDITSEITEEY
jgi:orotate phosphoribosyltransferase-like protein